MNIQILLLAGLWLLLQIMITTIDYKDKQIEPKQTEVKEMSKEYDDGYEYDESEYEKEYWITNE